MIFIFLRIKSLCNPNHDFPPSPGHPIWDALFCVDVLGRHFLTNLPKENFERKNLTHAVFWDPKQFCQFFQTCVRLLRMQEYQRQEERALLQQQLQPPVVELPVGTRDPLTQRTAVENFKFMTFNLKSGYFCLNEMMFPLRI